MLYAYKNDIQKLTIGYIKISNKIIIPDLFDIKYEHNGKIINKKKEKIKYGTFSKNFCIMLLLNIDLFYHILK
ncbi:hypothetical protein MUSASHINO07_03170 [Gemella sp. Musashino-2025]